MTVKGRKWGRKDGYRAIVLPSATGGGCPFDGRRQPGIKAFALGPGRQRRRPMQFRLYPQGNLAGVGFIRLPAPFRAHRQIVVDGRLELPAQFRYRRRLENDYIPGADHFPLQRPGRGVIGYGRAITLILHHGVNPASRKNLLTAAVAP